MVEWGRPLEWATRVEKSPVQQSRMGANCHLLSSSARSLSQSVGKVSAFRWSRVVVVVWLAKRVETSSEMACVVFGQSRNDKSPFRGIMMPIMNSK